MPRESSDFVADRDALFEQLAVMIDAHAARGDCFALLIVKIRQFRRFNISRGYPAADRLLDGIASCLGDISRQQDFLARVGNAEFAMLLPEVRNPGHASLAAIKILESLREPIAAGEDNYLVNPSIGIAIFPEHGENIEDLYRNAEKALCRAHGSSQAFATFDDVDNGDEGFDFDFESALARAIEKDQFELYFQPQVCLANGRLFGAEALIRWKHEDRGFIRPDIFIPVAERSGQISDITRWTLNAALWFLQSWPAQMSAMKVAVNLSTRMLGEPDFAELVSAAASLYGVEHERLTLEITESALVEDLATSFGTLDDLKSLGINISIDDFGTGYSSMAYFKNIPANELKIDQSFIRHMLENRMDQHIVETIIRMAQGFDLAVVAEGVEEDTTLRRLESLGCDVAQGYHIARPMPRDEFMQWTARYLESCASAAS